MTHRLQPSQYAVLATIMLTASVGDSLLARGMKEVGHVDMHHLGLLWQALFNPFVAAGIVLLIGFFSCYTTALSWADLSFVMPATAFGYVVLALLGKFWLHEQLNLSRWLGIALIVCAVGFVAGGPSRTEHGQPVHPELDHMDAGAGR
jgi:drug/metabolite transporter (DMT)-like permease